MNKALLIISLLVALQNFTFAQIDKSLADIEIIKQKCKEIADDYADDKISSAFDKIREIWVLPTDELDYLEKKSIEQINLVADRFGTCIGNKFVKEQLIEDILYKVTYVIKFEKHALRLEFIFYNGKGGRWYLNNFKWDDSLKKLFEG